MAMSAKVQIWSAVIAAMATIGASFFGSYQFGKGAAKTQLDSKETQTRISEIVSIQIERLNVKTSGSVTREGTVEHVKGLPFHATLTGTDKFRINYFAPLKTDKPIVVATATEADTTVCVISTDKTGFTVQGYDISAGMSRPVSFNFILVEPVLPPEAN